MIIMIQNRSGGCNDLFQDVGISSGTDIDDACCATWDTKEIVQLVQLAVLCILWLYVGTGDVWDVGWTCMLLLLGELKSLNWIIAMKSMK